MSSAKTHSKTYKIWLVGSLGGFLTGFGLFAFFVLGGIKNVIDEAWIAEYFPTVPVIKTPTSSHYAVVTVQIIGIVLLFLGIILFAIAGKWAYSSQKGS